MMREGQHADHNTQPKRSGTIATSLDRFFRMSPAFILQSRSAICQTESHQHVVFIVAVRAHLSTGDRAVGDEFSSHVADRAKQTRE